MEERVRDLAPLDVLGRAFDGPTTESRDLLQCPLQRRRSRTLVAVRLVDEEARDPPIRAVWSVLVVARPNLIRGNSSGEPDGVPADTARRRRTPAPRAPHRLALAAASSRWSVPSHRPPDGHDAPTTAPHSVVPLDEIRERRPGLGAQRLHLIASHDPTLRRRARPNLDAVLAFRSPGCPSSRNGSRSSTACTRAREVAPPRLRLDARPARHRRGDRRMGRDGPARQLLRPVVRGGRARDCGSSPRWRSASTRAPLDADSGRRPPHGRSSLRQVGARHGGMGRGGHRRRHAARRTARRARRRRRRAVPLGRTGLASGDGRAGDPLCATATGGSRSRWASIRARTSNAWKPCSTCCRPAPSSTADAGNGVDGARRTPVRARTRHLDYVLEQQPSRTMTPTSPSGRRATGRSCSTSRSTRWRRCCGPTGRAGRRRHVEDRPSRRRGAHAVGP